MANLSSASGNQVTLNSDKAFTVTNDKSPEESIKLYPEMSKASEKAASATRRALHSEAGGKIGIIFGEENKRNSPPGVNNNFSLSIKKKSHHLLMSYLQQKVEKNNERDMFIQSNSELF